MTSELAPPSPTFNTTRRFSLDRFSVHRPPQQGGFSTVVDSNSRHESVTLTTRLPLPPVVGEGNSYNSF
ncbi:hypothetical protein TNCV_3739761 [Trichonephila clavipes]|nr:hypothetical protein TNCV_4181951 [Trichonephila clavipes]GFV19993.1 hypothetical protein TNCV_3739761 [Trichonephila clavipes]